MVQAGMRRGTQVARVARIRIAEERVHGRKATARKEAKEQRKVAEVTGGHAGLVSEQDVETDSLR